MDRLKSDAQDPMTAVADLLLSARGLAEAASEKDVLIVLDMLLYRVARKLARDDVAVSPSRLPQIIAQIGALGRQPPVQ